MNHNITRLTRHIVVNLRATSIRSLMDRLSFKACAGKPSERGYVGVCLIEGLKIDIFIALTLVQQRLLQGFQGLLITKERERIRESCVTSPRSFVLDSLCGEEGDPYLSLARLTLRDKSCLEI